MEIQPSDAQLVAGARLDPRAFEALYRRYVERVFRYARARVDSVQAAEDITSAAFLDALAALPAYRERGRFAAWLFTIARRSVQDHYRSASRQARVGEPLADDVQWPGLDPAAVAEVEALRSAMARLSPDRREALELRFFAGLDVREVAQVMNRGEGAVKMLVHRGLGQLRLALAEGQEQPGASEPFRDGPAPGGSADT